MIDEIMQEQDKNNDGKIEFSELYYNITGKHLINLNLNKKKDIGIDNDTDCCATCSIF